MFETHNSARRAEVMALTGMQALQLYKASPRSRESGANEGETQGSAGASLTMAQAQRVLDDLVEEGWFDKSPKGFLSLSPRALMELRGWLIDTYNEPPNPEDSDDEGVERIKMCEACREIVTVVSSLQLQCLANWEIGIAQLLTFCFFFSKGQRCSNRDCCCRLHDACVRQFFRTLPEKKCPICKSEWTEQDFVGERAAKPQNRTSTATAASSSRRTTMAYEDNSE